MNGIKALHRLYKRFISPLLGERCRFFPSCSDYCVACLETHGLLRGSRYAIARLLRCHPFCEGGFDPVPLPDDDRTRTVLRRNS